MIYLMWSLTPKILFPSHKISFEDDIRNHLFFLDFFYFLMNWSFIFKDLKELVSG